MRTGAQTAQSKAEQLAASRALTQKALDGKHLVPTKTCKRCLEPALVKGGTLQSGTRGFSGTAVVPEITICLNKTCGQVAVRRDVGLGSHIWKYGAVEVKIIDGPSYMVRQLPQPMSETQRAQMKDFLIRTAPR